MRDENAAELGELSPWLDRTNGDWSNEQLTLGFAKIGGYTTSGLETIVADVQASTSTRISASEALEERVGRLPILRERSIAFIRRMLTRPEANTAGEEMIVGFLVAYDPATGKRSMVDINAPSSPAPSRKHKRRKGC